MAGPWEWGERNSQGGRSDLLGLRDLALSGVPFENAIMDGTLAPTVLRHHRLFDVVRSLSIKPRSATSSIRAAVIYGPPGIGKTHAAHAALGRAQRDYFVYWSARGWWDGYAGQRAVIMDDITGNEMEWGEWLKVLDKFPHRVPVKGASVNLSATFFLITTNIHPKNWSCCSTLPDPEPLLRRIVIYNMYDMPANISQEEKRNDLSKFMDEIINQHNWI